METDVPSVGNPAETIRRQGYGGRAARSRLRVPHPFDASDVGGSFDK